MLIKGLYSTPPPPPLIMQLNSHITFPKLSYQNIRFQGPKIWNSIDGQIKTVSLCQFKSKTEASVSFNVLACKTGLFCSANDLDVELTESWGESNSLSFPASLFYEGDHDQCTTTLVLWSFSCTVTFNFGTISKVNHSKMVHFRYS